MKMDEKTIATWHRALTSGELDGIETRSGQAVPSATDAAGTPQRAVFPGAFNPLHRGHRGMADVAEDMLDADVAFEISVENVDKPPLTTAEIQQRLQQFPPSQPVWLTRAARFQQKAKLFPRATFVVGVDTMARIANVRYYGGDHEELHRAITHFADQSCRFLVFGRKIEGQFQPLSSLQLPSQLSALCIEVPRERFHEEISSTRLRIAQQDVRGR